ncbi:ABC transporter permease [Caloramator sp. mosi_1]|uniref:ABC transporter permease n=1 Tax=Caloramator sp. mosi_1 TaxID=3023090 RepID=UPI002362546D|nr:ABC transporter permease [Caloramator sp. mosi_1]WDC83461.1 ABC transporter permease [Caloramator sp. mosi_1]
MFWLFVDSIIIIIITKFFYEVNWGSNYLILAVIILLTCILALSMGITVYMLVNNFKVADALLNILVIYFTFISGGYVRIIDSSGTILEKLQYTSPNFCSTCNI